MKNVEELVENALRNMIGAMPYSSISVSSLCVQANVSRNTFYKCYRGKGDVLKGIFVREVIAPQAELCRLLSFEKMAAFAPKMEHHMFEALSDDGDFYRSVVRAPQGGYEAFVDIASAEFESFNRTLLAAYGFSEPLEHADYIAVFFAEAKARMMAKWAYEDYPLTAVEAGDLYARMVLPFWRTVV